MATWRWTAGASAAAPEATWRGDGPPRTPRYDRSPEAGSGMPEAGSRKRDAGRRKIRNPNPESEGSRKKPRLPKSRRSRKSGNPGIRESWNPGGYAQSAPYPLGNPRTLNFHVISHFPIAAWLRSLPCSQGARRTGRNPPPPSLGSRNGRRIRRGRAAVGGLAPRGLRRRRDSASRHRLGRSEGVDCERGRLDESANCLCDFRTIDTRSELTNRRACDGDASL